MSVLSSPEHTWTSPSWTHGTHAPVVSDLSCHRRTLGFATHCVQHLVGSQPVSHFLSYFYRNYFSQFTAQVVHLFHLPVMASFCNYPRT